MFKKLIYFLLSIILVVVLAVGALIAFVDPNDFKPLITQEVKKATGRDLSIDGNIDWQFWPNIGISIEKAALSNPEGFAQEHLVQFVKAEVSVAVLPLLSNSININQIRLHDAKFFMQILSDGTNNLDGLVTQSEPSQEAAPEVSQAEDPSSPETAQTSNWKIALGEIDIQNASAVIQDDKANSFSEITSLNLSIAKIEQDVWVPIDFGIKGKQNSLDFALTGKTEAKLAAAFEQSQLKNLQLNASVNDNTQQLAIESINLTLNQLGIALSSELTFDVKGKAKDLSLDATSELKLAIDEKIERVDINDISLIANLTGKSLPKEEMKIALNGSLAFDKNAKLIDANDLSLVLNNIELSGKASAKLLDIPKIRFDFMSEIIDLDSFLGTNAQSKAVAEQASSPKETITESDAQKALTDIEPDLSGLKNLDIAGKIAINQFIASNIKVSDLVTEFSVEKGKANLKRFDAKLYEGTISATASLDATQSLAKYKVNKSIKNVQVQPLLMDAASMNLLSGKGNIGIDLEGEGLSSARMLQGLVGRVSTSFVDGAIHGINVSQVLREAKAALKGEKVESQSEAIPQTTFGAFEADFDLAQGVASTNNMHFTSPIIRLKNEGSTNLLDKTMDFDLSATIVNTKDKEVEDLTELKGITVPIKISGTWQDMSYRLDLKKLLSNNKLIENTLQQKAEKELDRFFEDAPADDPLKKATTDLLNQLFQ